MRLGEPRVCPGGWANCARPAIVLLRRRGVLTHGPCLLGDPRNLFGVPGGSNQGQAMKKQPDDLLTRIEAFNVSRGGGVLIRKAARGYSFYHANTGRPIARLRPTGKGDQVEVMWWSHRDKWDQIGDFGPL